MMRNLPLKEESDNLHQRQQPHSAYIIAPEDEPESNAAKNSIYTSSR